MIVEIVVDLRTRSIIETNPFHYKDHYKQVGPFYYEDIIIKCFSQFWAKKDMVEEIVLLNISKIKYLKAKADQHGINHVCH